MRSRICVAIALVVGFVLSSPSQPAHASGGCIHVWVWGPSILGSVQCNPGTGALRPSVGQAFSCDTGLSVPNNCVFVDGGPGAYGISAPGGCYGAGTIILQVGDSCRINNDDPPACKNGQTTSDARRSNAGHVGDPVNLRTGALGLDPVDVDLGHGLRFARHYSSKTTLQATLGKTWSHSLEWKLARTTAGTYPVLIVTQPQRPAIPFVSIDGTSYTTSALHGGSISVDASDVVHYKGDDRVEADFDTQNRLIALRYPAEPEIVASYAASSTTFTNGSQTLVISYYSSGTSAGLVSSVVANGEIWSYAYSSAKYLTTVIGPDPSTPSTSDTVTWTYTYAGSSNRITKIDRTTGSGTATLASWAFNGQARVSSADEPALEQPLQLAYSTPQTGVLRTNVSNSSSQTLALFDTTTTVGALTGVLSSV